MTSSFQDFDQYMKSLQDVVYDFAFSLEKNLKSSADLKQKLQENMKGSLYKAYHQLHSSGMLHLEHLPRMKEEDFEGLGKQLYLQAWPLFVRVLAQSQTPEMTFNLIQKQIQQMDVYQICGQASQPLGTYEGQPLSYLQLYDKTKMASALSTVSELREKEQHTVLEEAQEVCQPAQSNAEHIRNLKALCEPLLSLNDLQQRLLQAYRDIEVFVQESEQLMNQSMTPALEEVSVTPHPISKDFLTQQRQKSDDLTISSSSAHDLKV